ncbi:MAG: T9SS type A sorting domain-containing protein [Bacteroidales bacterium]|nr:T9SS type A sorting domain-containing protein [Bacteroidales bacterium]
MKSKKVLLGLILAVFATSAGAVDAQTKANYQNDRLVEIGPDNIGGRTRALIATGQGESMTLYTGGVAGGLYKATNKSNWEYIPYYENSKEVTLPITDMILAPDNKIYIATGEGNFEHASNQKPMAPKGRGLFVYDPATGHYAPIAVTNPATNPEFSYVNRLAAVARNGKMFLYVATTEGLYRWKIDLNGNGSELNTKPAQVHNGAVQDVELVSGLNIGFFTSGERLYKVSSLDTESQEVDISSSNAAFGEKAKRIKLATAVSNNRLFLYALVADSVGMLKGVYLTHDQQHWTALTTATVTPFTTNHNGEMNLSLAIDPYNHSRIIIGGASLWVGEGFVEGSNYIWNKVSLNEDELNGGNYMAMVYSNSMFVHSGIHAIVPYVTGEGYNVDYFITTDGGVYRTNKDFNSFVSFNKGLNITQINHLAVAPDGSIISGANNNAAPFIESRMAHHEGPVNNTWYDNTTSMNHIGNVLWMGSGSSVAASMFQQVKPTSRRGLFISSNGGNFGRGYSDYSDFTNTQTWTIRTFFTGDKLAKAGELPKMVLWETANNTAWNDSVTFTIDTMNTIIRDGKEMQITGNLVIKPGDIYMVPSIAHFHYPFPYTFTKSFKVKDQLTHKTHNPIANRLFITGEDLTGNDLVLMTAQATDYRKVYDTAYAESTRMAWALVYKNKWGYNITNIAVSQDADCLFIALVDPKTNDNFIYRLRGISKADVNNPSNMNADLIFDNENVLYNPTRITQFDTLFNGSVYRFHRPITSLSIDKRNGQDRLLVTFGGTSTTESNMIIFNDATKDNYSAVAKNVANSAEGFGMADPVYSGMIEYTSGAVYAGTEKGVFVASQNSFNGTPVWNTYGAFNGVPVTSMVQQTNTLKKTSVTTHAGINVEKHVFAKTKYPFAMYFGTYGRGIFMDMTYVTDTVNEVVDSNDWVGITTVNHGNNSVKVYPNPAVDQASLDITIVNDGQAIVNVYDINGRRVISESLGHLSAGSHNHVLNCNNLGHGMYLVNVIVGNKAATSKLIVR